jgi:hypothetical protein
MIFTQLFLLFKYVHPGTEIDNQKDFDAVGLACAKRQSRSTGQSPRPPDKVGLNTFKIKI